MIRFAANQTSWDDQTESLIPGGMGDRMIAPILAHLPQGSYVVSRMPDPCDVNAYLTTPSVYGSAFVPGPNAVLINHGIADKNIRIARRVNAYGYIVVPGPQYTERLLSSGIARTKIVELGYPKLDPLFSMPRVARAGKLRVLYAPTHGGGGENKHMHDTSPSGSVASRSTSWWTRDQVIAALGDRFEVTFAPHPRHRPDRSATFAEYLSADVVIADGGSTIWEAWALGIPVVLPTWLTGAGNVARRTSMEAYVYRRKLGHHATSAAALPDLIEKAAGEGLGTQVVRLIDRILPPHMRGSSGQRHADFLLDLDRKTKTSRGRLAASRTRSAA